MGYTIDELKPGMRASLIRTVTERDVELFGEVSGDFNPLHFDEEFARKTIFKGRIAHGIIAVGFISNVLGNQLPGSGTVFVSAVTRFKAPVRIGDTVETVCTVRELLDRRRVMLDCVCSVGSMVVVEGETIVMAPGRSRG